MEKFLENLIKIVSRNPENIKIFYSNINGEETVMINDVEIGKEDEKFDDSKIKENIKCYNEIINSLDDCLFCEIIDELKNHLCLKTFDELLNQLSYSKDDAHILDSMIMFANSLIYEHVQNRICDYQQIIKKLS